MIKVANILDEDLTDYAENVQALFLNIKWQNEQLLKRHKEVAMTVPSFKHLDLPHELISNGILFLWSNNQILLDLMTIIENWGFSYIENFAFVQLSSKKILRYL